MFGSVLTNPRRTEKETTEVSRFDMSREERVNFLVPQILAHDDLETQLYWAKNNLDTLPLR